MNLTMRTPTAPTIPVAVRVLREGDSFIAHATELDVSSHGRTADDAVAHLREALVAFLDEASRMGMLDEILQDAGYVRTGDSWTAPTVIKRDRVLISLPA